MVRMMRGCAHDRMHVYRVLALAMHLAKNYDVDQDVLAASCLLHDIGRGALCKSPGPDHAAEGGRMAGKFLLSLGWDERKAGHVRSCIASHGWKSASRPESIEAEILFDADKLDACGAVGVARTLLYLGAEDGIICTLGDDGLPLSGKKRKHGGSFFREYHKKLKRISGSLFTEEARMIAKEREKAAKSFYKALEKELKWCGRLLSGNLDGFLSE